MVSISIREMGGYGLWRRTVVLEYVHSAYRKVLKAISDNREVIDDVIPDMAEPRVRGKRQTRWTW